jgi:uncharacterized protein YjbJ (UPF0337 family)
MGFHARDAGAESAREVRPEKKGSGMDNQDQVKGKVKQAVGDLTGNEDLKKEGKADEKAGEVKEFVEGVKDKADDLIDTVKDKISKH